MITNNQPKTWKLDGGGTYSFVATTTKCVLPGCVSGAWVVSALVQPVNADETSQVGETTTVASGKPSASACFHLVRYILPRMLGSQSTYLQTFLEWCLPSKHSMVKALITCCPGYWLGGCGT